MTLSRRDWADIGVFVLVTVSGVYLAFMPVLVDAKYLTLRTYSVLAIVLTVATFCCFGVSKFDTLQEDRDRAKRDVERDKREAERDKLLRQIAENQSRQLVDQGRAGTSEHLAAEKAVVWYEAAIRDAEEPKTKIRWSDKVKVTPKWNDRPLLKSSSDSPIDLAALRRRADLFMKLAITGDVASERGDEESGS